jgi:putative ABC transport system permease protein
MPASWRRYLRFWGSNVESDIDDELRFHIESRVGEYISAGHSPENARGLALDRFGDVPNIRGALHRHDVRKLQQQLRGETMDELLNDVRYGVRKLLHAPGFTLSVIAVLALGIGANTAIFSAVDAAFFRPLAFANPDQLVSLPNVEMPYNTAGSRIPPHPQASAQFDDYAKLDVFQSFAVHAMGGLNLEGGAEPKRVAVAHVSLDFFKTLGRFPISGRAFTPEEEGVGGPHAAILSHRLWTTQFGGKATAIGSDIVLNQKTYHVVGVMPADFTFPSNADLWLPLPMPLDFSAMDAFKSFIRTYGIARLAPGISPSQAGQRVLATERQFPSGSKVVVNDSTISRAVAPLQRSLMPQQRRSALIVLMASAGLVLLIACANVINLLLSRAVGRRREMAVRSVLGATRGRIFRQLVVESVLLALAGAVVGLLVARLGLAALNGLMSAELTAVAPTQIDPRVLAFTLSVALLSGIVFGIWPAFGAMRGDAVQTIKSGGAHGATSRDGNAVRGTLVVIEVALAIVLLVGSGLMLESFYALMSTDAGIQTSRIATAQTTLSRGRYTSRAEIAGFYNSVLDRLRATNGVQSAAAVNVLPLAMQNNIGLIIRSIDGQEAKGDREIAPSYLQVSPGYFETMSISLLRGRDLSMSDDSSTHAAVVSKGMADRLWPNEDPIGHHFSFGARGSDRVVVGVVADVRARRLEEPAEAQMYFSLRDTPSDDVNFVVRGLLPTNTMTARIVEAVHAIDPKQPIYNPRSMDDVLATAVAPRRTNTVLLVIFGVIAAALASIGVYGVLAYGVAQRTREIGVRVALGAQRGDVVQLIAGQGVMLTTVGIAIGIAGAFALSRLLESLLYEVSVHDPRIFIAAPVLLAIVALVATCLPAFRATHVDPMTALRQDYTVDDWRPWPRESPCADASASEQRRQDRSLGEAVTAVTTERRRSR